MTEQKAWKVEDLELVQGSFDWDESIGKKIIVIENFASYCPPCVKTMPELAKLASDLKSYVSFVSISYESIPLIKKFIKKVGNLDKNYPIAQDPKQTSAMYSQAYKVQTIPHAYIIDTKGNVVWNGNPGGNEFETKLRGYVNPLIDAARKKAQEEYKQKQEQTVKVDKEDLQTWGVGKLKKFMKENAISSVGCLTKTDLKNAILKRTSN